MCREVLHEEKNYISKKLGSTLKKGKALEGNFLKGKDKHFHFSYSFPTFTQLPTPNPSLWQSPICFSVLTRLICFRFHIEVK